MGPMIRLRPQNSWSMRLSVRYALLLPNYGRGLVDPELALELKVVTCVDVIPLSFTACPLWY